MNDEEAIPSYFICPISLEMMKDPVTTVSGITYDRQSIERWLAINSTTTICPVTKQPLPRGSSLTPNHTLSRLIQAWSAANHRAPPPIEVPLINKSQVANLLRNLHDSDNSSSSSKLIESVLHKLEGLASESEANRVFMVEEGIVSALFSFIVRCYRKRIVYGLEEALGILYNVRHTMLERQSREANDDEEAVVDSLTWILGFKEDGSSSIKDEKTIVLKFHAAQVLKTLLVVVRRTTTTTTTTLITLDRLKPDLFSTIFSYISGDKGTTVCQKAANALLRVLSELATASFRNRLLMIESNAVFHLIELELRAVQERRTTELILGILAELCSCADGRAKLLDHAAGIALVTKRILTVSSTADDRALSIVWSLCKFSATKGVLTEMLRVGTVAKVCMVLQANCGEGAKEKGRDVLRMHMDFWKKDSPADYSSCVEQVASLSTRYGRR